MAKIESKLTDGELEAKFNEPRQKLLKEIFGDTPCPIADISPKTVIVDSNWGKKDADFMVSQRPRIHKNMNADMCGVAEWNAQMRATGKIITKVREEELENLKAKPEPVR